MNMIVICIPVLVVGLAVGLAPLLFALERERRWHERANPARVAPVDRSDARQEAA